MFIRYNEGSKIWEYDSSGGSGVGPWLQLPFNQILFSSPDTNGILLKLNSGILDVRKGNDSAYAIMRAGQINSEGDVYSINGYYERNRSIQNGVWQSFTPQWKSTGTQPTIGNGSILGRYTLIGKTCIFHIDLSIGSTSTVGSGTYLLTIPLSAGGGMNFAFNTWGLLAQSAFYSNFGAQIYSATEFYLTVGGSAWSPTNPTTLTASDHMHITGTYEIA